MLSKILPSLCLLLFLSPFVNAADDDPNDPYKHFFNETWGDMSEELSRSKEQGKKAILIFFEMDEYPFCHYMKTNVLNQPKVQEYYRKHFLNFVIDIEGDVEMVNFNGQPTRQKDFAFKENRVRATPVIAFFDSTGKRIHRHIGKTNGVEEFMLMGKYIVEGAYKEMPFIRYKRKVKDMSMR